MALGDVRGRIIVLSGLPGVGKTAVAQSLGDLLTGVIVSTDALRWELVQTRTYTQAESDMVYSEAQHRVLRDAKAGQTVIFDATNMHKNTTDTSRLQRLRDAAADMEIPVLAILLTADHRQLRARIDHRSASPVADRGDYSEADHAIARMMSSYSVERELVLDTTERDVQAIAREIAALFGAADGEDPPALEARQTIETLAAYIPEPSRTDAIRHVQAVRGLESVARAFDTDTGLTPVQQRIFNRVLSQIDQDALDGTLLDRWGSSTVIDENVGDSVLSPRLHRYLHERGGRPGPYPYGHAGLTHTYGYLFSLAWTPHGWKRSRWINGEIADVFGLDRALFDAAPRGMTLLRAATTLASQLACLPPLDSHEPLLDEGTVERLTVTETVNAVDHTGDPRTVTIRTTLARPADGPPGGGHALVYTTQVDSEPERLITLFPVDGNYAERKIAGPGYGADVTVVLRFNAHLPGIRVTENGTRFLENHQKEPRP